MVQNITRRGLGLMLAACALSPSIAIGSETDYVFPKLLESVSNLKVIVSTSSDLREMLDVHNTLLIDVREKADFVDGHIPGAVHLDPNAVVAADAPIAGTLLDESRLIAVLRQAGIGSQRRIVFYDDKGGFHAARMFWLLEFLGHQDVAILNGGFSAWKNAQGSIETGAGQQMNAESAFSPAKMPRRLATADYILENAADVNTTVIDVRPTNMFADGHIPWATSIPWKMNLGDDGLFLPANKLRSHFEAHGVTPDRNVVIHCQVGLASSHSYVALRLLGFPRVRVYHRSWAEWGNDPSLPRQSGV